MKKFFVIFLSWCFLGIFLIPSVSAQATSADGFFGSYFLRITNPCSNNYSVITGFINSGNNFWERKCTDIREVLKKIPNWVLSIWTDSVISGANTTIKWPVASTEADISNDANGNTLVTKAYVDKSFSQVEVWLIPNPPIAGTYLYTYEFEKEFKKAPVVTLGIQNFWHFQHEACKRGGWFKRLRGCQVKSVSINMNPGAKVLRVTEKKLEILVNKKHHNNQGFDIVWIAVSPTEVPLPGTLAPIVSSEIPIEEEEDEDEIKQELQKHLVPPKAIMPFYAETCPDGWVLADGQNGTPDLRGEFVRGLDKWRNVDVGRTLGTSQGDAIRNITGIFTAVRTWNSGSAHDIANGVFSYVRSFSSNLRSWGGDDWKSQVSFDASRIVPTANENRPRNVALLYCMKQASFGDL